MEQVDCGVDGSGQFMMRERGAAIGEGKSVHQRDIGSSQLDLRDVLDKNVAYR